MVMEDSSNVFENGVKEVHNELVRISRTFEELMVRVQKNHEEYVHTLITINTVIQKAVEEHKPIPTKQANFMPFKLLGGQDGEKVIF